MKVMKNIFEPLIISFRLFGIIVFIMVGIAMILGSEIKTGIIMLLTAASFILQFFER